MKAAHMNSLVFTKLKFTKQIKKTRKVFHLSLLALYLFGVSSYGVDQLLGVINQCWLRLSIAKNTCFPTLSFEFALFCDAKEEELVENFQTNNLTNFGVCKHLKAGWDKQQISLTLRVVTFLNQLSVWEKEKRNKPNPSVKIGRIFFWFVRWQK